MRNLIILLLFSVFSGCAMVNNMDELLVLNEFGNEQTLQKKIVHKTDENYALLLKALEDGQLGKHKTKAEVLKAFGKPLQTTSREGGTERWLYRRAIYLQAKNKIYLYFKEEEMVDFEYVDNDLSGEGTK